MHFLKSMSKFNSVLWSETLCLTSKTLHCWVRYVQFYFKYWVAITTFHILQFRLSVVSNSLWPRGLQHTRPPCPSLIVTILRACSNSCPLSRGCHPTISSSVVPFSCCLQSFLALGSFQWVSSSHQVAKVLELQLHHQSFQWIFRTVFL